MALPKAYLTTIKNLDGILGAIQQGQAPKQFTTRFLEGLGFKTSSDRLMIGVLKSLRFLDDNGVPTQRYFEFLDQGQSQRVLADSIRDAYADLFQLNNNANTLARADLKGKFKTLTQGQYGEAVLDKMVMTFQGLAKNADFQAAAPAQPPPPDEIPENDEGIVELEPADDGVVRKRRRQTLELGGLVYNIQIQLPESRDPAVYDAIFTSLRAHLLT